MKSRFLPKKYFKINLSDYLEELTSTKAKLFRPSTVKSVAGKRGIFRGLTLLSRLKRFDKAVFVQAHSLQSCI